MGSALVTIAGVQVRVEEPSSEMTATAQRVNFPFNQALPAAAALHQLAQVIAADVEPARQRAARTAAQNFLGVFSGQFATRMQTSAASASTTANDLETAARNIAMAWADAQHQQQLYCYYAMVKDQRDNRSTVTQVVDWVTGDSTNYGHPPDAPQVPTPPSFAATPIPVATVPGAQPALVC